jgi:histidinol phosphatase-like enzyme
MVMAGHRYFIVSVREKEGIGRGEFTLGQVTDFHPLVTIILTEKYGRNIIHNSNQKKCSS